MKKKTKPKAKAKPKLKVLPPPSPVELVTVASNLDIVKDCVNSYEKNTGAKANQTRLIDFVRWCEENSGLL